MIEKLKENTKIKLISLLSAIVLWMYVMAVVDPQETKVFEGVPVSITNIDELKDDNFVVYPEVDLTTDVYVTGKLSALKNISKDDITVYGTITDAKEGNNAVYLKVNTSKGVSCNLKPDTLIIPLDRIVDERRSIDVVVEGKYKSYLDTLQLEEDSIKIYGPRTLVGLVQKIQATLTLDVNKDNFTTSLKLTPVDENGNKVDGVTLETESVNANISLLVEKSVPINVVFSDNNDNIDQYELSKSSITIRGKKQIIDATTSINTKAIDVSNITSDESKEVQLDIPQGIEIDTNTKITIKFGIVKELNTKFLYSKDELELRNSDSVDVSTLNLPNEIEVEVEYSNDISTLSKSDIILYIDLSDEDNDYKIKYESKYEFKSIKINPSTITK